MPLDQILAALDRAKNYWGAERAELGMAIVDLPLDDDAQADVNAFLFEGDDQ